MKKFIAICGMLVLVGCAGTSFNLGDNPVLNYILLACGDVPVAEFDQCVQDLKASDGTEDMTVAELVELLKTFETNDETPVE
jgi:hypothetical protein